MQLQRLGLLAFTLTLTYGCGDDAPVEATPSPSGGPEVSTHEAGPEGRGGGPAIDAVAAPSDAQVAAGRWIRRVFDLAAEMPTVPHEKTRGKLQAELVDAALQAGQVDVATSLAGRIENWRKGLAEAAIAVHHAKAGDEASAREGIETAQATEATLTEESVQGWRRDRVRVTIAEAYARLGDRAEAAVIQAAATPSEAGRLAPLSIQTVPSEDADKQMTVLEEIAKTGDLEQIRYALLAMAEFYGRFHDDKDRRSAVEKRIRAAWSELPIQPRIEILERLVEFDLEAGDTETARFTVDEMAAMIEENLWNVEEGVQLRARVAGLLVRADEPKAARKAADDALALYDRSSESIVSIWRGRALRPLAEAYFAMGDDLTASALYARVLDEAMINPNGRPRLEDLVATVASIAKCGFEPDEALEKKLDSVTEAIGAPW